MSQDMSEQNVNLIKSEVSQRAQFGDLLKRFVEARDVAPADICEATGMVLTDYAKMIRGERLPPDNIEFLPKLYAVLKIDKQEEMLALEMVHDLAFISRGKLPKMLYAHPTAALITGRRLSEARGDIFEYAEAQEKVEKQIKEAAQKEPTKPSLYVPDKQIRGLNGEALKSDRDKGPESDDQG